MAAMGNSQLPSLLMGGGLRPAVDMVSKPLSSLFGFPRLACNAAAYRLHTFSSRRPLPRRVPIGPSEHGHRGRSEAAGGEEAQYQQDRRDRGRDQHGAEKDEERRRHRQGHDRHPQAQARKDGQAAANRHGGDHLHHLLRPLVRLPFGHFDTGLKVKGLGHRLRPCYPGLRLHGFKEWGSEKEHAATRCRKMRAPLPEDRRKNPER